METEKRLIDLDATLNRLKKESWWLDSVKSCIRMFLAKAKLVDAVEVVRCKDCKHRGSETYCPMCFEEWYEIDEGDGYYDSDFTTHDRTIDEGFCDRGERKDNG